MANIRPNIRQHPLLSRCPDSRSLELGSFGFVIVSSMSLTVVRLSEVNVNRIDDDVRTNVGPLLTLC